MTNWLTRISSSSGTTAAKLVKQVRDDLDWIVMQCLEKEPARRYQTVNELIADIDRNLRHEPVLARPPSLVYTFRKLARRNRVAFVTALGALVFTILITVFAVTMTIQARRIATERDQAQQERERAQKVSNVAMNVFAVADPFQSFANGVSGSALLDQAARSIERELHDQPAPRARLLQALGRAYIRRGEFTPAIGPLKEAVQILGHTPGAETEALAAMIDLSMALRTGGDLHGAREVLVDAEDLATRYGLQRSAAYAKLLLNRGRVSLFESRIPAARVDFERSLQLYQSVLGARCVEMAEVLTELASLFTWSDDHCIGQSELRARQSRSLRSPHRQCIRIA